ncbi:hypothetical protein MLD38_021894 [Melastoma candidum]|uniref:Uncharacterized protein n=1 Tax=Melastoma candidum TaxID=119954 RepID=A0ACB9QI09_9MYRT|nr:hypothetical protein MLD38_021894 [Melastoma candidum]
MGYAASIVPGTPASSPSLPHSLLRSKPKPNPIPSLNLLPGRRFPFPPLRSFPNPANGRRSSFPSSAISFSPSSPPSADTIPSKLDSLVSGFRSLPQPVDRVKRLLEFSGSLPPLPDAYRVDSNRVMGCTAQVWLEAKLDEDGRMRFWADSDSEIARGYCSCLIWLLDGAMPSEVLMMKMDYLSALNVGLPSSGRSRVNTWHNVLISMQKRTKAFLAWREGKASYDPFPSLILNAEGIQAKGSYAEAQCNCRQDTFFLKSLP